MSQDQPKPDNDPTSVFGAGDAPSDPTAPEPQQWGQQPSGGQYAQGQSPQGQYGQYGPYGGQYGYAQQPGYDPNAYPQAGYDPNAYPPGGYDPNAYPQQPGYGQPYPGYDASGYGYGQYAPQPAYVAQQSTNTMAILSLVFAFIFPLLGLIFGIVARGQIKQTGEQGEGLAMAGIIISSVFIVLIVLFFVFFFVVFGAAVNSLPTYR